VNAAVEEEEKKSSLGKRQRLTHEENERQRDSSK
jgi:hypothetical protein